MQFFGNHLMAMNLIKGEDLVRALVKQVSGCPSLAFAAWQNQIFTDDQMWRSFQWQTQKGESWESSLRRSRLLQEDNLERLIEIQQLQKRPLGHLLKEVNPDVDQEKINLALKSFYENKANIQRVKKEFSFQSIEGDAQRQYVKVLDDRKKVHLEGLCNSLMQDFSSATEDENRKDLQLIADELSVLKESALYAKAEISQALTELMIPCVAFLIDHLDHLEESLFHTKMNDFLRGLDVLWEVRTFIDKSGSERDFWLNPISRENFANVYIRLGGA